MGWIAWVKGLCTRAEVLAIAAKLSIDPKMVAACCMLVWEWADDETEEGGTFVPFLSLKCHVDNVTGVPGFGDAMAEVGWILENGKGSIFPNWDRYNGPTAKTRMKEAARKANWRKRRDICPGNDGTKTGPTPPHPTVSKPPLPPTPGKTVGELEDQIGDIWAIRDPNRQEELAEKFHAVRATPADIKARRSRLLDLWGSKADTPESLLKHWGKFGQETLTSIPGQPSRAEQDAFLREQREHDAKVLAERKAKRKDW